MSASVSTSWRRFVGVATVAAVLGAPGWTLQARAMDDGEAPIWTGLGTLVGPMIGGRKEEKDPIQYRERSKLVIPPKMELPKPAAAKASASFPTDQDVMQAKKIKALEDAPSTLPFGRKTQPIVPQGTAVTMSATSGSGPSHAACLKDGVAVACPEGQKPESSYGKATANWNPLTWVGIEKKPEVVLGPEPARDNLTDPPPGYRAPVEGVGAKVSNN